MLTTFAIQAADDYRIPGSSSLIAGVGKSKTARCPSDMAYIPDAQGGFCIDRYEAAPGEACVHADPMNQFETDANLSNPLCVPVSKKELRPWVNVPMHQALALCAKVGKRLPSHGEWYRAALGTPDTVSANKGACALGKTGQSRADATGVHEQCVSSYGAYDMVGNVWEWIDATVSGGMYANRMLPTEGYVSEADQDGVPSAVGESSPSFGEDYFFADLAGVKGMFRGGFWSMNEKAGMFSINATIPTSFVGVAVGFRCVSEVGQ
jgi:formylglycine-generating enzyme required for sulfatase activity